jgi:hypothetical protein
MDEEILSPAHNHSQAHSSPKKSSNRNTPSKRGLTSHCTICSQEFTSRKAYINHIIDVHTVKSYVCKHVMGDTSYSPLCRKVFTIFVVSKNLNFNRNLGNWSIWPSTRIFSTGIKFATPVCKRLGLSNYWSGINVKARLWLIRFKPRLLIWRNRRTPSRSIPLGESSRL